MHGCDARTHAGDDTANNRDDEEEGRADLWVHHRRRDLVQEKLEDVLLPLV